MSSAAAFVREFAALERRVRDLGRTQRLANAAIPKYIPIYDAAGQLRITLGEQGDGTFAVTATGGLLPPRPSVPLLVAEPRGLTVVWNGLTAIAAGEEEPPAAGGGDGSWEEPWTDPVTEPQFYDPRYASYDGNPPIIDWDDYPTDETGWVDPDDPVEDDPNAEFADPEGSWPSNLSHVEIHLAKSTGSGFDPAFGCTSATQAGTFQVADSKLVKTILGLDPAAVYWCRLVAVTQSGRKSRPSDPVSVETGADSLAAAQNALEHALDAMDQAVEAINVGTAKARVWDDAGAAGPGPFAIGDIWFRSSDNRIHQWNGTAWVAIPDSGIQAALDAADAAAAAAAAAAATGNAALTTANGKNTIIRSTSDPGSTANVAGDVWWKIDGSGNIIAQWIGAGGTSWNPATITSSVIANLDVGKLVAVSALTASFTVQSTLTLGDATHNGSIQSYNYASSSNGFYLDKNGLVAKGGSIVGATVEAYGSGGKGAKLDGNGITVYGPGGAAVFYLNGSTGAITTIGAVFSNGDISGSTVTGGTMQTTAAANTGVKMTSTGLVAYHPTSHTPVFTIDATTGNVAMLGTLSAGSTVTGSTFQTSTGNSGVRITSSGQLIAYKSDGSTGTSISNGFITTFGPLTVSSSASVSGGMDVYGGLTAQTGGLAVNAGGLTVTGGITVVSGSTTLGSLSIAGSFQTNGNAINGDPSFGSLVGSGGSVYVTTGDGGRLNRGASTSSLRELKRDIHELDIDPDTWVALTPYEYTFKNDPKRTKQVGLMIDEMLAAGFGAWVGDADGRKQNVIHYTHLAVGQQTVLRNHHPRIAALETDRDALRAEVRALRAEVETLRAAA